MPLTREPKYKDIYTDEVDQKGGYVAKVRDKEARAAAKEAAETAKADLDAYKETNDAAVAALDDRLDQAELDIDAAEDAIDDLEDARDVLILGQDTQPTSPDNKIWIKETATPVVIPDMDDIADFVSFSEDQTARTDAEKAQARSNIEAGKEWALVWENASPSSAFAAQTISIDLSDYSEIKVHSTLNTSQLAYFIDYFALIDGKTHEVSHAYNISGSGGWNVCLREFTPSPTGVVFAGGFSKGNNQSSGNATTDNVRLAPLAIYAR